MNAQLLIPAGGMGTRLGAGCPKALVPLGGRPMLVQTLERFVPLGLVNNAVIVVPPDHVAGFANVLAQAFPSAAFTFVEGGAERQMSVSNGLAALAPETDMVVIHDAARPFVPAASVRNALSAAAACGAATVAVPSADTVLVDDGDGMLVDTPDRQRLWACQTPQVFRVSAIRDAHGAAARTDLTCTDDATLARHHGAQVRLVEGSRLNFKVTTAEDLALAEAVIARGLA